MLGSNGPAAQCYRLGNFVYMTGQTGFTLDGQLVGAYDPAVQARQACENIKALMEMAGGIDRRHHQGDRVRDATATTARPRTR